MLTDQQKQQIVINRGLDPSKYRVSGDENYVEEIPTNQQPSSTPTPYQPKLDVNNGITATPPKNSLLSTTAKTFAQEAPSALAGGAAAGGTLSLLSALGAPETGGLSLLGLIPAAIAAYGASRATKAVQGEVESQEWQQNVAQAQQEHPVGAALGGIATMPLGGFNPSIAGLGKGLGAIPKMVSGLGATAGEINALKNVSLGAALPIIQSLAESGVSGQPINPKDLLLNAAMGALFNKPNVIGRQFGFHPSVDTSEPTKEMLAPAEETPQPQTEQPIKQPEVSSEQKLKDFIAAKKEVETQQAAERAAEELKPAIEANQLAQPEIKPEQPTIKAPFEEANKQVAAESKEDLKERQSQGLEDKYQKTSELLEEQGKSGDLTPEWLQWFQKLGAQRNIKVEADGTLTDEKGNPVAGKTVAREGLKEVSAKVNPETAGADTPAHEIAHTFINDLRDSPRGRDQTFVKRYDKLVEQSPEYQAYIKENPSSNPEEFQATQTGLESVNRVLRNETSGQKYMKDLTAYFKTRYGKYATFDDAQRIMNYKMLHDPAYNKIMSLGNEAPIGVQPAVEKQQKQSDIHNTYFKAGFITPNNKIEMPGRSTHDIYAQDLYGFKNAKEAINNGYIRLVKSGNNLYYEGKPSIKQLKELQDFSIENDLLLKDDTGNTTGDRFQKESELKQPTLGKISEEAKANSRFADMRKAAEGDQTVMQKATKEEKKNAIAETTPPDKFQKESAINVKRELQPEELEENRRQVKEKRQESIVPEELRLKEKGPKPYDESQLIKEPPTPEEVRNKELTARESWRAVEESTKPEEMMASLKDAYDHTVTRKQEARTAGEPIDSIAARQQAILAQMNYLHEKWNTPTPPAEDLPKYSHKSLLFTKPLVDRVRDVDPELAKAAERFYPKKNDIYGKAMAPILSKAKGLSDGDIAKVNNVLSKEMREKQDYSNLLNPKQLALHSAIRDAYKDLQQGQVAANQPVTKGRAKLPPTVDPFYHGMSISPKVADELVEGTPAARNRLKNDYINYTTSKGLTPEEAEASYKKILNGFESGANNLTRFSGVRQADQVGLPDSWRNPPKDLVKDMSRYFGRASADRAFHDTFATNPDVQNALGFETNPWGVKNQLNPDRLVKGNQYVRDLMDHIYGEGFNKDDAALKTGMRTATAFFLGPLTNFHIAASSMANALQYMKPGEAPGIYAKALSNLGEGVQKALTHGSIKPDFAQAHDLIDDSLTRLDKFRSFASLIGKLNGRTLTDNYTKGFLQNVGEQVIKLRSVEANNGSRDAQDIMKHFDPDWKNGKTYSNKEIESLGANFGSMIHGAHDPRTLPPWMLKDTAIQPFFSLASWSIAQTNAWMRHVWTPATHGNFTPLIMSTLGSLIGGYVIKQGREAISDKKSPIPSLNEIVNSSRGAEGNIPLLAYNAMALSSYVGYGGIMSILGKAVGDLAFKNIPQAAAFPLDELIGSSAHRISQAASAFMNDPNADYFSVGTRLLTDLAKENFQLARIGLSWAAKPEDTPLQTEHYLKELNVKTQDLRRWKMTEGMPYDEQTVMENNPYLSSKMKQFKRTEDVGEAADSLTNLIDAAFKKADGNPDVLKAELHKLKANTYQTIPSPENTPLSFAHYFDFLNKTQGPEVARERLEDYFRHNAINQAKASMVPSL